MDNEVMAKIPDVNSEIRFLTVKQFMSLSTLSRQSVMRRIKDGSIPATKVGRRVLIDSDYLKGLRGSVKVGGSR